MRFQYSDTLLPSGLLIPIVVTRAGREQGAPATAKIDTGADRSVIPERVRLELKPQRRGELRVKGAFDTVALRKPTYLVLVHVEPCGTYPVEVVATERETVLLGRDVLNQFILHADGPAEVFDVTPQGRPAGPTSVPLP